MPVPTMDDLIRHVQSIWLHDTPTLAATAAAIGVASHLLYWMHGLRAPRAAEIAFSHIVVFTLTIAFSIYSHDTVWQGLRVSGAIIGSYLAGVFGSVTIYRVFFHPLRRFPGPFAARFSKTYSIYLARNGKTHESIEDIFDEYGDVVRTAPNELVFRSVDAIQKIHGSHSACTKRGMGVFEAFEFHGVYGLETILDSEAHRWRRQVWDKAQNQKAMLRHELSTRKVCRSWIEKLASDSGKPVEVRKAMLLIAYDNMGYLGFSKEFGATTKGEDVRWLDLISLGFDIAAKLGGWLWPILVLGKLGLMPKEMDRLVEKMGNERVERDSPELEDVVKYFLDDLNSDKPKSFFSINEIYADVETLLVAATDTTSATLVWVFYYLTINPSIKSALLAELTPVFGSTIPGEFSDPDLSQLPYLKAVIDETLRIKPVSGNNSPRLTPPEGIVVDGTWIPGNCHVFTPPWSILRHEKYFVQAQEFIPERWTTRPELVKDRRAFIPFNTGRWSCAGKKLAMMLMRIVIAYTLYEYDFEFAPGEDGTAIIEGTRDATIVKPGTLRLVFTKKNP